LLAANRKLMEDVRFNLHMLGEHENKKW